MAPRLQLGIHQAPVHRHLKTATIRGDEGERGDLELVRLQQVGRQTDGPVRVVSNRAVLDGNGGQLLAHDGLLPFLYGMNIELPTPMLASLPIIGNPTRMRQIALPPSGW